MGPPRPDTEELIRQADGGDRSAMQHLLTRHRDRLKRMVTVRMDPRLATRLDASDIVQETLTQAFQRLPDYLRDRKLPFYAWLRQLAWNRLVEMHRKHIIAQRRSIRREAPHEMALSDQSAVQLVDRLVASGTSPGQKLLREEMSDRVRATLAQMAPADREMLILRYLEQLSNQEAAAILQITVGAARTRHVRALQRLTRTLSEQLGESSL